MSAHSLEYSEILRREARRDEINIKRSIIMTEITKGCIRCGVATFRMCPQGCGEKLCSNCLCPW